jgi:hypothetical protein
MINKCKKIEVLKSEHNLLILFVLIFILIATLLIFNTHFIFYTTNYIQVLKAGNYLPGKTLDTPSPYGRNYYSYFP